ncbi:MAG: glutaredoxin family protein [Acidimicrobiales bacterium]
MPADPIPTDRASLHGAGAPVGIVVYRRAGCGFCASLRRQLRRAGVATVERDIWADPDAAAFVRRHARGNETVPTVDVAGTVLVNPTTRQVLAAARQAGIPVPDPPRPWWQRRRPNPAGSG